LLLLSKDYIRRVIRRVNCEENNLLLLSKDYIRRVNCEHLGRAFSFPQNGFRIGKVECEFDYLLRTIPRPECEFEEKL